MRNLTAIICLTIAVLLAGSWVSAEASDLAHCSGSYNRSNWHNCFGTLSGDVATYVGEFQNGNANGQGTLTYNDGHQYVGEWRDGQMHGQGTFIFSDGDKYVGEFKHDQINGEGTYTDTSGSVSHGIFSDGKLVEGKTYTKTEWEFEQLLAKRRDDKRLTTNNKKQEKTIKLSKNNENTHYCKSTGGFLHQKKVSCELSGDEEITKTEYEQFSQFAKEEERRKAEREAERRKRERERKRIAREQEELYPNSKLNSEEAILLALDLVGESTATKHKRRGIITPKEDLLGKYFVCEGPKDPTMGEWNNHPINLHDNRFFMGFENISWVKNGTRYQKIEWINFRIDEHEENYIRKETWNGWRAWSNMVVMEGHDGFDRLLYREIDRKTLMLTIKGGIFGWKNSIDGTFQCQLTSKNSMYSEINKIVSKKIKLYKEKINRSTEGNKF